MKKNVYYIGRNKQTTISLGEKIPLSGLREKNCHSLGKIKQILSEKLKTGSVWGEI